MSSKHPGKPALFSGVVNKVVVREGGAFESFQFLELADELGYDSSEVLWVRASVADQRRQWNNTHFVDRPGERFQTKLGQDRKVFRYYV